MNLNWLPQLILLLYLAQVSYHVLTSCSTINSPIAESSQDANFYKNEREDILLATLARQDARLENIERKIEATLQIANSILYASSENNVMSQVPFKFASDGMGSQEKTTIHRHQGISFQEFGDGKFLARNNNRESSISLTDSNVGVDKLVKEYLINYKVYLNKLMSRIIDNSHHYVTISNQLSLIKDECSMAAHSIASFNFEPIKQQIKQQQQQMTDNSKCDCENQQATNIRGTRDSVRSSDVSQLLYLIKHELGAVKDTQDFQSELRKIVSDESNLVLNKTLLKRFNEIDSIVKQIAILVTKNQCAPHQSHLYSPNSSIILTYNSSNDAYSDNQPVFDKNTLGDHMNKSSLTSNLFDIIDSSDSNAQARNTSRWLRGQKHPLGVNGTNVISISNSRSFELRVQAEKEDDDTDEFGGKQNCETKVRLAAPKSCQALRQAGANCSGAYYIFVNRTLKHVYCSMDSRFGWLVVLQRVDKSLTLTKKRLSKVISSNLFLQESRSKQMNFDLDWYNYKLGFGDFGSEFDEFFVGLELLHQLSQTSFGLTTNKANAVTGSQLLLLFEIETESGDKYSTEFDNFSIGSEESNYKLTIGSSNSSISPIAKEMLELNSSYFFTFDSPLVSSAIPRELHACKQAAARQSLGWWMNENTNCNAWSETSIATRLNTTFNLSTNSNSSAAMLTRVISANNAFYWPIYEGEKYVRLRKIVLKVRAKY